MMMRRFVCLVAALCSSVASAQPKTARVFSDHMVLQRDRAIPVWGSATPGEKITVYLDTSHKTVRAAADGTWELHLPSHAAGGPFVLRVSGESEVDIRDVLIGDLWLASGQSNMEMPLRGFKTAPIENSAAEIAAANYPEIRLLKLAQKRSDQTQTEIPDASEWAACTPQSAAAFSAVGYFFARDLYRDLKVPIGVIDSTWGGTPVESWMSADAFATSQAHVGMVTLRQVEMDTAAAQSAKELAEGKTPKPQSTAPHDPDVLYNAMIAPLLRLPFRGVIWYQGESNAGGNRPQFYQALFRSLIASWRVDFNQPQMPFLFVQLAGFGSNLGDNWPTVREAQRRTLQLPYTGMAVTLDLGEDHQIHYPRKAPVGERLSLLARHEAYGERLIDSGPLFLNARPQGDDSMRVEFLSSVGLKSVDAKPLADFELAGGDGVFLPADARIDGQSVVVRSSAIQKPVYVRYAWKGFAPEANLTNGANLPASPFTSAP